MAEKWAIISLCWLNDCEMGDSEIPGLDPISDRKITERRGSHTSDVHSAQLTVAPWAWIEESSIRDEDTMEGSHCRSPRQGKAQPGREVPPHILLTALPPPLLYPRLGRNKETVLNTGSTGFNKALTRTD